MIYAVTCRCYNFCLNFQHCSSDGTRDVEGCSDSLTNGRVSAMTRNSHKFSLKSMMKFLILPFLGAALIGQVFDRSPLLCSLLMGRRKPTPVSLSANVTFTASSVRRYAYANCRIRQLNYVRIFQRKIEHAYVIRILERWLHEKRRSQH